MNYELPLWFWLIILVLACLAGKESRDMWNERFHPQTVEQCKCAMS